MNRRIAYTLMEMLVLIAIIAVGSRMRRLKVIDKMIPMQCIFIFIFIVCMTERAFAQDLIPSAQALLRGMIDARKNLEGCLEIERTSWLDDRLRYRSPRVTIEFSGAKWRASQRDEKLVSRPDQISAREHFLQANNNNVQAAAKAGLGKLIPTKTTHIFDGSQLLNYSELDNCFIKVYEKGIADVAFDVRTLGIVQSHNARFHFDDEMAYSKIESARVIGSEIVDGKKLWCVVNSNQNAEWKYWISDQTGFRVYKYSIRGLKDPESDATVSTSEYSDASGPLPTRVTITGKRATGIAKNVYLISNLTYNKMKDHSIFSFAGLDIPIGQMVIDERQHKLLYYDGEGLTDSLNKALERGRELIAEQVNPSKPMWPFYLVLTVVGLALAVLGYRKYARK